MKEQTINRINSIGKAGNIIALICRIILIIAMVGLIAALVVANVMPEKLVEVEVGTNVGVKVDITEFGDFPAEAQDNVRQGLEDAVKEGGEQGRITSYEVTESSITINTEANKMTFGFKDLNAPIIVGLFYVIACYVILWFVAMLCRAFRDCQSPFEDNVIKRMRNFAFSLIPWTVLSFVLNIVISRVFLTSFQVQAGFGVGTILLVLIILGLCSIFRYGAKLQQEHDETL